MTTPARSIILAAPEVRAALDTGAVQIWRAMKPQPVSPDGTRHPKFEIPNWLDRCPFRVGNRSYVKETWAKVSDGEKSGVCYRLDGDEQIDRSIGESWRSPVTMPLWASRMDLEITGVQVRLVQSITEAEAIAAGVPVVDGEIIDGIWCPTCRGEGVHGAFGADYGVTEVDCSDCDTAVKRYRNFWDRKNAGEGFPWGANPWCWVIDARRVRP